MNSFPSPVRAEEPDEILTLEELAARLRLSVTTVRRLIKRRILSPLRTGRALRFHWPTVKYRLGIPVLEAGTATEPKRRPNPFLS